MNLQDWKTAAEIFQSIVTALGIILAGIGSYLTFLRGRSFAPNIQIRFNLKRMVALESGKGAMITVTLKNIGKTKVSKESCVMTVAPAVFNQHPPKKNGVARIDSSQDEIMKHLPLQFEIFLEHQRFEPGEEASEDVLIEMGDLPFLKVNVMYFGYNKQWSSSAIFDHNMTQSNQNLPQDKEMEASKDGSR